MITLDLTDEEAKMFRDFRVHQDDFQRILEAGAFGGMESGKIILNINVGRIQNIVVERRIFTRHA